MEISVLQAQLDEVEALQACYDGLVELSSADANAIQFAATVVDAANTVDASDVPALSGCLRLPDVELAGAPVQLKFVLPKQCSGGQAALTVLTNADRQDADRLQAVATSTAEECAADSMPCLLLAASRLTEEAQELAEAAAERQRAREQTAAPAASNGTSKRSQQAARQLVLSQRCLWFHHIKNSGKRKSIVEWGGELGLGGFSKPGFPGVVLVEGAGCDIDEYVGRLRRLRWQAMAVRGEQDEQMGSLQELEAARRLPRGVHELGEEGMGQLAAACREAGLEQLFLTALKL